MRLPTLTGVRNTLNDPDSWYWEIEATPGEITAFSGYIWKGDDKPSGIMVHFPTFAVRVEVPNPNFYG